MKILINARPNVLSQESVDQLEAQVTSALEKFGFRIIAVDVHLSEFLGNGRGVDKECRLVVRTRKLGEVVATARDESVSGAVSRAIQRAQRSVARRIQERSLFDADRRSGIGFVFHDYP